MKTIIQQFSGKENDRHLIQERVAVSKQKALEKAEYYRNLSEYIDDHLQSIERIDELLHQYEFAKSPKMFILHDEESGWLSKTVQPSPSLKMGGCHAGNETKRPFEK